MEHPIVNEMTQVVEPIMRQAGDLLLSYFRTDKIESKRKSDGSYVCNVDVASETLLKQELSKIVPEASFFAEESGISGNNDYRWVIDPIDGTTNFVHGMPYFCISVAFTYKDEPLWGAVFNPLMNDFFCARKGQGAYLNGSRLEIKPRKEPEKSILVIGLPYTKHAGFMTVVEQIPKVAKQAYAFRHYGAVALDQAYVACGSLDAIFCPRLGWWDVAAGMLLITEAGGLVSDFQGNPVTPAYKSYAAGSPEVQRELLKLFEQTIS